MVRRCYLACNAGPALGMSDADALDLRDRFSDLATAGRLNEALALVRAVVRADRSDVLTRQDRLAIAVCSCHTLTHGPVRQQQQTGTSF